MPKRKTGHNAQSGGILRGGSRGRKLTPEETEEIVQLYAVTGNKLEVARKMGVTRQTVANHLAKAENDGSLAKVREEALLQLAGKAHNKALEVLDSITPADMESGRIPVYNNQGELVRYNTYGPSLMQKVTSAAILTDKVKVLEDIRNDMRDRQHTGSTELPIPENVQEAVAQISSRIKRLRILDLHFEDKHPEVANRLQDIAAQSELQNTAVDAEFEELDFDNPS